VKSRFRAGTGPHTAGSRPGNGTPNIDLDRGCFACMLGGPDRRTLFLVAAEWPASMMGGERTGQVLTIEAAAPGVGWP